mgnify:CR=1 FL=1
MDLETLRVDRDGGVVTVTLNRPAKKNAVSRRMWDELLTTFAEVADRAEDRVMVLTGSGDAFCSGADLSDLDQFGGAEPPPQLVAMRHVADVALELHRIPKPTIAKVNGVAAGAGCNMAFGCDLIVASDGARFSQIFARRGMSIDFGGSWLLPRLVGLHKAKELAFFGDIISADDAMRIGLVNKVVPAAELDSAVAGWAERLAAGPTLALSLTKTMLNHSYATSMDQALEDEGRSQHVTFSTRDIGEAMRAFAEKREPKFTGR